MFISTRNKKFIKMQYINSFTLKWGFLKYCMLFRIPTYGINVVGDKQEVKIFHYMNIFWVEASIRISHCAVYQCNTNTTHSNGTSSYFSVPLESSVVENKW